MSVSPGPEEPSTSTLDAGKDKKPTPPPEPTATYAQFFQYLSTTEAVLLPLALLFAMGTGAAQPMMLIAFGKLFESLGAGSVVSGAVVDDSLMLQIVVIFLCIGIGMFVGQWVCVAIVDTIAASQMLHYKRAYLKAVLRQDVAWYDTAHPEQLSTQFA